VETYVSVIEMSSQRDQ